MNYTYETPNGQVELRCRANPPQGWNIRDGMGRVQNNGVLFEGPKGRLVADYGRHKLLPEDQFKDFTPPRPTIPPSAGHHREWLEAIKGRGTTTCNFDYSGALAETVLLGNVAFRCGRPFAWDEAAGKADAPEVAAFLRREYRKGWSLEQ